MYFPPIMKDLFEPFKVNKCKTRPSAPKSDCLLVRPNHLGLDLGIKCSTSADETSLNHLHVSQKVFSALEDMLIYCSTAFHF